MFRPCVLVIIKLSLDFSNNYTISGVFLGCEGWWDHPHTPQNTLCNYILLAENTLVLWLCIIHNKICYSCIVDKKVYCFKASCYVNIFLTLFISCLGVQKVAVMVYYILQS